MSSGEKLDGTSCRLANKEAGKLRKLDSTYVPHLNMMDDIKPIIKSIYTISDNQLKSLPFAKMTAFSDNIISNLFEGISLNFNFTQK